MRVRVHHFAKSEANILKSFSIKSDHYGHIAGVSNIVNDFLDSIKANKPLRPRHHLHKEYPCHLHGVADNFDASESANNGDFGIIRSIQIAQDGDDVFYLRFETEKDFYYIPTT